MNTPTIAEKLKTAFVNRTSWEDMEQIARDQISEELYRSAAALLDPDTVVTDDNEYHRGLVELIMEFHGMGSDDKDDIANNITERVMTGRAKLNAVINRHFPTRLGTFYIEGSDELAAVEDRYGNMWRVWADGDTQKYSV
jgi:hypothetical protein